MCSHKYNLLMLAALLFSRSACQHSPTDLGNDDHNYQIAYYVAGDIFVINADGTGKRLLAGGCIAKWSPQGDRIAFFGNANDQNDSSSGDFLCTIKIDGSAFRQLSVNIREGELGTCSLDWSPDGKQLVFYTTKYHASGGFAVVNADGSNEINLTPEGFWRVAEWSPEGSKIALEGALMGTPTIYMINPDGTGLYNLIDAFAVNPLWRPDGKKIKFSIGTRPDTTKPFQYDSYICNPDGSNLQNFSNDGKRLVDWSPDQSKVLYSFHPEEITNLGIMSIGIMNADGSEPKVLLGADESHGFVFARFSPDNRKIAYVRLNLDHKESFGELWVMNADGSRPRKLDDGRATIFYDWSPK